MLSEFGCSVLCGICMFGALITVLKVRLGTGVTSSSALVVFGDINCSLTVTFCKKCQVYFLGLIKSIFIILVFWEKKEKRRQCFMREYRHSQLTNGRKMRAEVMASGELNV